MPYHNMIIQCIMNGPNRFSFDCKTNNNNIRSGVFSTAIVLYTAIHIYFTDLRARAYLSFISTVHNISITYAHTHALEGERERERGFIYITSTKYHNVYIHRSSTFSNLLMSRIFRQGYEYIIKLRPEERVVNGVEGFGLGAWGRPAARWFSSSLLKPVSVAPLAVGYVHVNVQ